MTAAEVQEIRAAGIRSRALQALIEESIRRGLKVSAEIAQRELRDLKRDIYKRYEIRI